MIKPSFLNAGERVVSTVRNHFGGKIYNIGIEGQRGVVRQVVNDVLGRPAKINAENILAYYKKLG